MTVRELIASSFRLIGVTASGETVSASEETDALEALNLILDEMQGEGFNVITYTASQITTTVNLTPAYKNYLKWRLAAELSAEFERQLSPSMVGRMLDAELAIRRQKIAAEMPDVDVQFPTTKNTYNIFTE
jgi:hypothetical protein